MKLQSLHTHQPSPTKVGDGSAWQSQLAGTYLHIGRRLSVHIIGDDEISFEEESVQVEQERCWSSWSLKDTWP